MPTSPAGTPRSSQNVVAPNAGVFSYIITCGELLVGLGLLLGAFTGVAAFFGLTMNASYLLGGTVSVNPILAIIGIFVILAWRNAGWIGLDRYLLPALGTPWQPGKARPPREPGVPETGRHRLTSRTGDRGISVHRCRKRLR